jgi:hypothetical protein
MFNCCSLCASLVSPHYPKQREEKKRRREEEKGRRKEEKKRNSLIHEPCYAYFPHFV